MGRGGRPDGALIADATQQLYQQDPLVALTPLAHYMNMIDRGGTDLLDPADNPWINEHAARVDSKRVLTADPNGKVLNIYDVFSGQEGNTIGTHVEVPRVYVVYDRALRQLVVADTRRVLVFDKRGMNDYNAAVRLLCANVPTKGRPPRLETRVEELLGIPIFAFTPQENGAPASEAEDFQVPGTSTSASASRAYQTAQQIAPTPENMRPDRDYGYLAKGVATSEFVGKRAENTSASVAASAAASEQIIAKPLKGASDAQAQLEYTLADLLGDVRTLASGEGWTHQGSRAHPQQSNVSFEEYTREPYTLRVQVDSNGKAGEIWYSVRDEVANPPRAVLQPRLLAIGRDATRRASQMEELKGVLGKFSGKAAMAQSMSAAPSLEVCSVCKQSATRPQATSLPLAVLHQVTKDGVVTMHAKCYKPSFKSDEFVKQFHISMRKGAVGHFDLSFISNGILRTFELAKDTFEFGQGEEHDVTERAGSGAVPSPEVAAYGDFDGEIATSSERYLVAVVQRGKAEVTKSGRGVGYSLTLDEEHVSREEALAAIEYVRAKLAQSAPEAVTA